MASRGRGVRRYSQPYGYSNWGEFHQSKRAALSSRFGGIDDDVINAFLSLDAERLYKFFDAYERKHGSAARTYARKTYHQWKRGTTQISAQTAERLLEMLPPFLGLEIKYELIRTLRDRFRSKQNYSFTVNSTGWEEHVLPIVQSLIEQSGKSGIPEAVKSRLSWLSSGDSQAAEQLIAEAEQQSALISAGFLNREIENASRLLTQQEKRSVTHRVELPLGTIALTIVRNTKPTLLRNKKMDNENNEQLTVKKDEHGLTIPPGSNFLEEAIKSLTAEQRRQIAGKASQEALRLQVSAHEAQAKHENSSAQMDHFLDSVHRLDARVGDNTAYEAQTQVQGASGTTTVRVKRDAGRNWMFVAAALLIVLVLFLLSRR